MLNYYAEYTTKATAPTDSNTFLFYQTQLCTLTVLDKTPDMII